MQGVFASIHGISDVKRKDGTAYQFLRILGVVKGDGSIGAYAFELQEVALALLRLGRKSLLVDSTAVQVAVAQLAVAVVVVEVMRKGDTRRKTVGHSG